MLPHQRTEGQWLSAYTWLIRCGTKMQQNNTHGLLLRTRHLHHPCFLSQEELQARGQILLESHQDICCGAPESSPTANRIRTNHFAAGGRKEVLPLPS